MKISPISTSTLSTKRSYLHRLRQYLIVAVLVIIIAVLMWIQRSAVLTAAARMWIVQDPLRTADAIAVLGGGENLRPFVAADLYQRGLADKILVANVKPSPIEVQGIVPARPNLLRDILLKLDVHADAIVGFGINVSSTYEEALALAAWAREAGAHTIIVPTELFSTRRQRWIINRELGPPAHMPWSQRTSRWNMTWAIGGSMKKDSSISRTK